MQEQENGTHNTHKRTISANTIVWDTVNIIILPELIGIVSLTATDESILGNSSRDLKRIFSVTIIKAPLFANRTSLTFKRNC